MAIPTLFTVLKTDAQLQKLATEMKAFAKENPLTPDDVKKVAEKEPGTKEIVGPMIRIHGPVSGDLTKKYSRFICLNSQNPRPIQVSYIEYLIDDVHMPQLVISNCDQNQLTAKEISRIGCFFLNMKKSFSPVETPKHVVVLMNHKEDIL